MRGGVAGDDDVDERDYSSSIVFAEMCDDHHKPLWVDVFGHAASTVKQYMVACPHDDESQLLQDFQALLRVVTDKGNTNTVDRCFCCVCCALLLCLLRFLCSVMIAVLSLPAPP